MSRLRAIAAAVALALTLCGVLADGAQAAGARVPHIRHVFIIVLENQSADHTFGPDSPAPYLADNVAREGGARPRLLRDRPLQPRQLHRDDQRPVAEPPDPGRLPLLQRLRPGNADRERTGARRGLRLSGPRVQTIANQLKDVGLTWKGYMEDMAAKAPGSARELPAPLDRQP